MARRDRWTVRIGGAGGLGDGLPMVSRVSLGRLSLKWVKLRLPVATTVVAEWLGSRVWNHNRRIQISL